MAQKAAQRHFDGLSEVTSALHRHSHHELRRRCRLKPDPNLQGGKFSSEGNRGLLILQPVTANCERSQTHVYVQCVVELNYCVKGSRAPFNYH